MCESHFTNLTSRHLNVIGVVLTLFVGTLAVVVYLVVGG
jgi:hypothetical protein